MAIRSAVELKDLSTYANNQRPVVWKFKTEDYASIRNEYKSIREKSTLQSKKLETIRAEHRRFADRYPQLFKVATSPEICDDNVYMLLDMSEKAKDEGKNDMDEEAAKVGQKFCDEYADPARKR